MYQILRALLLCHRGVSSFGEREGEMCTLYVHVNVVVSREPYVCMCLCIYLHIYIFVCVCTGICYQCPVPFKACQVCRLTDCVSTAAALYFASFFYLSFLQAGGQMEYSAMQQRWSVPDSARIRFYSWFLIHEDFFSPLLTLTCWREWGCFEGEVPAESLVTR